MTDYTSENPIESGKIIYTVPTPRQDKGSGGVHVRTEITPTGLYRIVEKPDGTIEKKRIDTHFDTYNSDYTVRSKALDEAKALINGDRQEEYGTPQVNFQRIVDLWNVLIPRGDSKEWTRGDVALALLGLKMARAAQGYKRDTYVDIAGYAALAVELNETEDE